MNSFAQALDLRNDPAAIASYREHHQAVWPAVTAALRAAGISHMEIFLLGNRLFMYFKAPDGFDPARDYHLYASDPACIKWEALMRTLQTPTPFTPPGQWWAQMERVFDLHSAP